ncbi:MAG TPA: hypothetical protein VF409_08930 [Sphingomonas sp.]
MTDHDAVRTRASDESATGKAGDRLTTVRASAARRLAALPPRGDRPDAAARLAVAVRRREESELQREAMIARWRHKNDGTPETHEKIAALPDRRRQSPLYRMERLGKISADERAAAEQIAGVIERIGRAAAIRSVSLETRVDHAGSGRDHLVESLARVRLEVAYRAWRDAIPEPKAMVLDMVTSNRSFVEQARKYGLQWRTARKRLIAALRLWPSMMAAARREVERDDVDEIYRRIGSPTPLPPPSRK